MMKIVGLEEIRPVIRPQEVLDVIARGFSALSSGRATVPPVGHLDFEDPPGDCHIKYGYISGDDQFVVKIATGFYRNPEMGLPSGHGLMLVFNRRTGQPEALLRDEGWLTDVRTAAAGAVAARHLAAEPVRSIGIVGTGVQARMQLDWLAHVTGCRTALVWGRSPEKAAAYCSDMESHGFHVRAARSVPELCGECNLIVTTTPSRVPILHGEWIQPGTHVTAVGADGGGKQELDVSVFGRADVCVVDSLPQCRAFGDSSFAIRAGFIDESRLVELGRVILDSSLGRRDGRQITVADLTGVAVQDIAIASLVLRSLRSRG